MNFLGYFGALGNAIFVICSTFFLTESRTVKKVKIVDMISDNWFFAILFLTGYIILGLCGRVSFPNAEEIIESVFPVTYAMNWFVGCYILYYAIHPFLNRLIENITREEHKKMCFFLISIYFVGYFIFPSASLYYNQLVGFIIIHYIVSYIKQYVFAFTSDKKANLKMLIYSTFGLVLCVVCIDCLGMKIDYFNNRIMYFSYFNFILIFLQALAIFNLMKDVKIKNSAGISLLSSTTLLCFIIHENLFFRIYYKPLIFEYWLELHGKNGILFFSIIFGGAVYIVSNCIAIVYKKLIAIYIHNIFEYIFNFIRRGFGRIYRKLP